MSDADLDMLLARARDYTVHSHAKHTLQNYAADWKHFTAWCTEHGRRALPAAPETILCYVVALVDRYAVSTIERRLASISYYHKQARHPLPTKDPEGNEFFTSSSAIKPEETAVPAQKPVDPSQASVETAE